MLIIEDGRIRSANGPHNLILTRERQATAPEKTGKLSVEKQCLEAAPRKGRRPGHVLYTPCRGFSGRPWFDALFYWGAVMSRHAAKLAKSRQDSHSFPLPPKHWRAIIRTMGLSNQLARVAELVLFGFGDKAIAEEMGLALGTVKDYLARIGRQTATKGRVELIIHILAVSHDLLTSSSRNLKR